MTERSTQQRSSVPASENERAKELLARARDHGRVMALTDAVFAIIMTLLVLDIRVPRLAAGENLAQGLLRVWPNLLVFVISFLLTGMYWVSHRDLFTLVRGVDRGLVWLNILFLLPVALVPFAASLLAEYSRNALALQLYGLLLIVIELLGLVLWVYIRSHPDLLFVPIGRRTLWSGAATVMTPALLSIIAILLAGRLPDISLGIYLTLPLLYFLAITFLRRSAPKDSPERDFM